MLRYASTLLLAGLTWGLAAVGAAPAQQAATLTGTVEDANGAPLPGANVVLLDSDYGTAAGADGSYSITGIEPGTYSIRVTFIGYETIEEEITFEGGAQVRRTFSMERAPLQGEGVTVTVGSRARDVAAEDMAVPVDVYGTDEIQLAGAFETGRILKQIAPSVNFPQNTLSDGMDALRSFTMRGLSPDQTLVLVNGKRFHKSALVNRLGSGVAGGSSPVDINAIPANAIKRMEVLRDGASSQYGSDAIAGVVNIRLKNEPLDPTVETRLGGYVTDPYPNDGTMYSVRPSFGVALGDEGGFLNFFGEYRLRTPTNRAGPSGTNPNFGFPWPTSGTTDEVADADDDGFYEVVEKNRTVGQPNFHWGDGRSENILLWANGAYPVANLGAERPTEIYAFGGYSYRKGKGQGFYRHDLDDGNWQQIHPDGFLPNFENPINDYSASVGLRGVFGEWNYDLNLQRGANHFQYNITNSINASYGPLRSGNQTEFYAGEVSLAQSHVQLDVDREYDVGFASPLNVAAGAVFRGDTYQIESGERASWAGFEDAPWEINQNGAAPPAGAQVFPGFRPSQEVDETRTNIGTYVDLEANVLEPLLISVAGRFENYSDFGSTFNWKVASRLDATDWLSLRGTAQTGFRAPNQAQKFFSKVSTTFINNRPFQTGIFPVNSNVGNALGIPDLDEETSLNLSAGLILEPFERFQISADYFNIQIDDRIILSDDLGADKVVEILRNQNTGAATASFFSNSIDTRTQGVDFTTKYAMLLADGVQLQLRGAFNWTDTEITGGPRTPRELGQEFGEEILPPENQRALTEGSIPNTTTKLTARLSTESFNVTLRGNRYGEQLIADDSPADEYTMGPEYIFGAEVGYSPLQDDQVNLSVGVDNIFDIYPDRVPTVNDPFDVILPYPRNSPFGFNGRFVYSRLTISL
ncbi:iron complex outermembrane receptor protein [Salinibacter ruber]|jgi:iron complex outermembrane receptor protein|uniref:Iron complex outermembrane receptor protein n=2 Tax=Salinibacter ruber TaxID=146919 RepID=A0A9X2TII5_9BACT|nr:TonB-dependent receptor [Salinibacter ruber]MCS3659050.1 iron complex outermembrane receptor protein [Salinibacter ruber]MCS3699071.1 iron complex outermembrane receptor protein [Salinibacter ruber]MCS3708853.1 iron complex outermembrane receptor protein [Salinibacter ruber]MCS3862084.1 iron complex outermembrane receptor protein [Salinibacter ruber]MCS4032768.1 iron complex outermembrane receptor protein [Salinibacter ruber]